MAPSPAPVHERLLASLLQRAERLGLNVAVVRGREAVEPFPAVAPPLLKHSAHSAATPAPQGPQASRQASLRPADLLPGYRTAIMLGSAGRSFWLRMRRAEAQAKAKAKTAPQPDPLDRYSEEAVEALRAWLARSDPQAVSAYPFAHARQVWGFRHLLGADGWCAPSPIGLSVHPRFGPWFAWRGVLLSTLALPTAQAAGVRPEPPPCVQCPAPCVAACPAAAVTAGGLDWQRCADYRLAEPPCRETCLAREACPEGAEFRYFRTQLRHHHGASLRSLQRWRSDAE